MSRLQEIRDEIAITNDDLEETVQMLEHEAKEAVEVVREIIEHGADRVRDVAQALSPTRKMQRHPGVFQGACFGMGLYLAKISSSKANGQSISLFNKRPLRTMTLIEPIVLGLAASIVGKTMKKRLPRFESQVDMVQSALITEMSYKFLREITAV